MKIIINNRYSVFYKKMVYSGGEVSVRISQENLAFVDFKFASIIGNITSSDDVFEILLLTDALRRINSNIKIHLFIPYFPYARQDRVCNPGESLAVKVMADLINLQRYDSIQIYDAHSDVTPALLNNCSNIHCRSFVNRIPGIHNMTLVAPDAGAEKKVRACAEDVHTKYITATKTRDTATGAITGTKVDVDGMISGDVCIVDDICDGGRTFVELGKVLRGKMYKSKKLYLYVTHGIFSQGTGELRKYFDKVYCANPWDEKLDPGFMEKV